MNIERMLIENFIDLKMSTKFLISNPKGILEMTKQVRLVVGEGDSKIEVGVATVEKMDNGDRMVTMTISNPALIKALGGSDVKGIIPRSQEDVSE